MIFASLWSATNQPPGHWSQCCPLHRIQGLRLWSSVCCISLFIAFVGLPGPKIVTSARPTPFPSQVGVEKVEKGRAQALPKNMLSPVVLFNFARKREIFWCRFRELIRVATVTRCAFSKDKYLFSNYCIQLLYCGIAFHLVLSNMAHSMMQSLLALGWAFKKHSRGHGCCMMLIMKNNLPVAVKCGYSLHVTVDPAQTSQQVFGRLNTRTQRTICPRPCRPTGLLYFASFFNFACRMDL